MGASTLYATIGRFPRPAGRLHSTSLHICRQRKQQRARQPKPAQILHDSPPPANASPASDSGTPAGKHLAGFFCWGLVAYLGGVGMTPAQSVEDLRAAGISAVPPADPCPSCLKSCGASAMQHAGASTRSEFNQILLVRWLRTSAWRRERFPASNRQLVPQPQARRPCARAGLRGRQRARLGALCRPLPSSP